MRSRIFCKELLLEFNTRKMKRLRIGTLLPSIGSLNLNLDGTRWLHKFRFSLFFPCSDKLVRWKLTGIWWYFPFYLMKDLSLCKMAFYSWKTIGEEWNGYWYMIECWKNAHLKHWKGKHFFGIRLMHRHE